MDTLGQRERRRKTERERQREKGDGEIGRVVYKRTEKDKQRLQRETDRE